MSEKSFWKVLLLSLFIFLNGDCQLWVWWGFLVCFPGFFGVIFWFVFVLVLVFYFSFFTSNAGKLFHQSMLITEIPAAPDLAG